MNGCLSILNRAFYGVPSTQTHRDCIQITVTILNIVFQDFGRGKAADYIASLFACLHHLNIRHMPDIKAQRVDA